MFHTNYLTISNRLTGLGPVLFFGELSVTTYRMAYSPGSHLRSELQLPGRDHALDVGRLLRLQRLGFARVDLLAVVEQSSCVSVAGAGCGIFREFRICKRVVQSLPDGRS